MPQYSSLLQELQSLKTNPPSDGNERKALLEALRDAEFAVERPVDTIHRVAFAPIQTSVAKTAIDLKLFNSIAARAKPISLEDLAAETGANSQLLRRLLRFCSLYGLVEEPTPMYYLPNERTRTMAQSGVQAGIGHYHDVQGPAYRKLPSFLQATHYDNVTDVMNTPFQAAHNTKQPVFVWAATQPSVMQEFGEWMDGLRKISSSWLDAFPIEFLTKDTTSASPLFIDIGGSIGHQCDELKRRLPNLTRSIILQDQPHVVQHALPGIEAQAYDFFTPQPLKNASFYYIKSCLHDWPDEKVLDILRNQVSAMGPDSRMLIDEIVLPEKGGHWRAAEMDIALMACAASFERTEKQWNALFEQAGLLRKEIHFYDDQVLYATQILAKIESA